MEQKGWKCSATAHLFAFSTRSHAPFGTFLARIDRSNDTLLRSILLFFLLGKPAIQGVCPTGVFKTLCVAGFFALPGFG